MPPVSRLFRRPAKPPRLPGKISPRRVVGESLGHTLNTGAGTGLAVYLPQVLAASTTGSVVAGAATGTFLGLLGFLSLAERASCDPVTGDRERNQRSVRVGQAREKVCRLENQVERCSREEAQGYQDWSNLRAGSTVSQLEDALSSARLELFSARAVLAETEIRVLAAALEQLTPMVECDGVRLSLLQRLSATPEERQAGGWVALENRLTRYESMVSGLDAELNELTGELATGEEGQGLYRASVETSRDLWMELRQRVDYLLALTRSRVAGKRPALLGALESLPPLGDAVRADPALTTDQRSAARDIQRLEAEMPRLTGRVGELAERVALPEQKPGKKQKLLAELETALTTVGEGWTTTSQLVTTDDEGAEDDRLRTHREALSDGYVGLAGTLLALMFELHLSENPARAVELVSRNADLQCLPKAMWPSVRPTT